MKTILVGVNSKYIHTNLAIRYLKANCDFPLEYIEFTIKDSLNFMFEKITSFQPDIIGFSVYIWNIEIIQNLLKKIKDTNQNITVILGGPESSYEYDYFLKEHLANYIISNEGEISFNLLLKSLHENTSIKDIPNISYYKDNIIYRNTRVEIDDLNQLKNPYHFDNEDITNKIQYIELSRGCPYNCSYCLASLEEKVRFFNLNTVKQNIEFLYHKGAKTFKFLDRTFNLKPKIAMDLFRYIIENDFSNAIFQFEINGDILSNSVIDYLNKYCPENRIRFEIGIQSIHQQVNHSVNRFQNNEKLFQNIRSLRKGNVILHLDLIAGLPYENIERFKETFDAVFNIYARELQLGFLKMLKGTKLYYEQKQYGYVVQKLAPYEIISNQYLSKQDMDIIHIVEESLEIYWNKNFMNNSIEAITRKVDSPFEFFYNLGKLFLSEHKSFHRYQLSDVFQILELFLGESNDIYEVRKDYLIYNNIKPKIYWNNSVNKNELIRSFHNTHKEYNINELYKYSMIMPYMYDYLLVIYFPTKKEIHKIKALF